MNKNNTDLTPFVEYQGNLYGEIINIKTEDEHKEYQMDVNLFGDGSEEREKWDEYP